jgi:HSP20 family protein
MVVDAAARLRVWRTTGIDEAQSGQVPLRQSVLLVRSGGRLMALPTEQQSGRREMAPSRDFWEPFSSMRRDMERLFEDFSRGFGWGPPAGAQTAAPRIDVSETETELNIEAELPGVDEKDVEVVLSNGRLTIKGEKRHEKEEKKKDYHLVERSYGSFARTLGLPFDVDPEQVRASFDKGVLKVTVPKPAEVASKEKKIPIGKR